MLRLLLFAIILLIIIRISTLNIGELILLGYLGCALLMLIVGLTMILNSKK